MNRRSKRKHPHLEQRFNTKARRYFIETDYIDGVKSEDGELVIRKLTDEEKDFLDKFYKEWLCASFNKDGEDFYNTPEERSELYHDNYVRNYTDIYNIKQRTGVLKYGGDLVDALIKDSNVLVDPEDYLIKCEEDSELGRVKNVYRKKRKRKST